MTDRAPLLLPGPREEYILLLLWADDSALAELVSYRRRLCSWITVTVLNGSPEELYNRHGDRFPPA